MADLEGLKKVLRSLVVSSAATMDAASLLRDYRRMMGEALPAARHGFRDPVQFLRERCGDCFLFHGPQGNPILTLIVPDAIKHIDQYVQSQKSSKLVRGKRRSVPEAIIKKPQPNLIASTFSRVPPKIEEANRNSVRNKPAHTEKLQPELPRANQQTEYRKPEPPPLVTKPVALTAKPVSRPDSREAEPLEAPVKDEQSNGHEDGAYSRQKLQRFLEKRMPVYQSQRLSGSTESLKDDDDSGRQTSSSLSSRSSAALSTLQAELARLVARRPQGVWCSQLLRLYEEEYGRELNFARFRYPSVSACACAVPALAARRARDGDWLLTLQGDQEAPQLPLALRLRRAPRDSAPGGRPASRTVLDPDDALPGIDYDPDVYPADCLSFLESIPAGSVADVRPGDMLGVVVGEVYSPSHLWLLRLGEDFDLMEQYMDEMTEYYGKGEGATRLLAAGARRPGQYCSSVFEGDWHRSLIVQLVDSDTVKVRHVDYGTVDTVEASSLRPLRRAWAGLPAQAVRARLAGLRPAAACRRWPRAAAAHCLRLVRERRLVANVVAADREENILEVFLIDTSTEEDVNVTEQMIRAGHADPRPLPALGARESYLLPRFPALETGATPNYAEIHALLQDGIALEFVDSYRSHVAPLLPSSSEGSESAGPAEGEGGGGEADGALGSDESAGESSPAPPLATNRVPMALSLLRLGPGGPEPAPASPSPVPASTVASLSPVASPVPEFEESRATPSPAPSPVPPPAPLEPPAAAAPPPAPAPGPARHPASFYALPFCPCAPTACCPKPAGPLPLPPPLRYTPGYFRPRVSPPPQYYAQYPRPPVSVGYYANPLAGQSGFSSAGQNPYNFSPAQPNFVPNSMQNPQMFVATSAHNPQHFVSNSAQHFAQKPQNFGPSSAQASQNFGPNFAQASQNFGPSSAQASQNFGPSFAQASQNFGSSPALNAQNLGPNPAQCFQRTGPSPAPSLQNIGSNSPLHPARPATGAAPAAGADSTVRLSADECEFFELLSRVEPGAAHRFMIAALRRAREAAGAGGAAGAGAGAGGAGAGAGAGPAPDRTEPLPKLSTGLNPDAVEFRSPTLSDIRPPPGFESINPSLRDRPTS